MSNDRVRKELLDLTKQDTSGVSAKLTREGDFSSLVGVLAGPKDTPFEGGTWSVSIDLPRNYPFEPPKMKFTTPLWHPNVSSQTGAICIDILKDAWSPALTLKTALLSLQALLASPEPGDPQDAVVARQYLSEPATWEQTARAWTRSYATREAASAASGAKVARLAEMGFPAAAAARALQDSGGDEQGALEALLSGAGA
jgi:ubiquitin-conjugating enzyme (huntingtin interacting protein 2)